MGSPGKQGETNMNDNRSTAQCVQDLKDSFAELAELTILPTLRKILGWIVKKAK